MDKRKLFSGILVGIMFLFPLSKMTVSAEDYWPGGPEIQGESAVVMEASTKTVLFEKNPHQQMYPASITKIMTTLLALENCSMDEEVTFSYESVHNIDRDSTHIFRDVGEIMTMEQCLYAVMLGSANDCAYAVAEHVGKGYENFIAMMNDKAAQLGCTDTHFSNPHGLQDEQHYTSAYDMALIAQAAMENETFRMLTDTERYTIPFTNKHPDEETPLVNHHKMLTNYKGETQYLYEHCIGGKTGYTDMAQNTLVTFAEKDGMTLICVVMREDSITQYQDTRTLLDYCFDNFALWNVSENASQYQISGTADAEVFGIAGSFVDLDRYSQIVLPKTAAFENATYQITEINDTSDVVAVMEYSYAGRTVGSADIKAMGSKVEQYPFHNSQEEEEKGSFEIKFQYVAIGAAIIIGLAGLGFFGFYLFNNIYIIRHRFQTRRERKKKYKVIKEGKHTRWRNRW